MSAATVAGEWWWWPAACRVAAAAAFHPGGLVQRPDSPHLLADRSAPPSTSAARSNDSTFTADHAEKLDKASPARPCATPHRVLPGRPRPAVPTICLGRRRSRRTPLGKRQETSAQKQPAPAKQRRRIVHRVCLCDFLRLLGSTFRRRDADPDTIQPTPVRGAPWASHASSCVRGSARTHFHGGGALHRRDQCSVLGALNPSARCR